MKFSEAWLREWVDPPIDRQALVEQLTMAGLEVQAVVPVASPLPGVVVARIDRVEPHPAGRLSVCQVQDGGAVRQVVCAAPNARPGLISALARPGALLPGDVRVEQADIRGVSSAGMLCSAAELGLGEDAAGILDLGDGHEPGAALYAALTLNDHSIEVDLTPNRGDCLSLRGLAREVGVHNGLPVRAPPTSPIAAATDAAFAVVLEAPEGCPRYLGRVISGVNGQAATPIWMRERLRRSGLRSIHPVVDVTNYVLLELGQPMHVFDLQVLRESICVRWAATGEVLRLLGGREVELDPSVLVIADGGGPVALAGVIGGERSGVQPSTQDVFLECAYFDPLIVAATARRFGLHTDASQRYERGVDFDLPTAAMERATALLLDIAGGQAGPVCAAEAAPHLPGRAPVSLRQNRLRELAGADIDGAEVDALFARLGFEVLSRRPTEAGGLIWTIAPPSHRFDIVIEADLVEEVCRIHGYQRIPSILPKAALAPRPAALQRSSERRLKEQLAATGFQEVITYSFIDPTRQGLLDPDGEALALANPMSSEQSVMRTNLLPGLTEVLRFNQNRQQPRAQLFELGLCFKPSGQAGGPLQQVALLGGLLWGTRHPESWHGKQVDVDFFDLKGAVESLLEWALGPNRLHGSRQSSPSSDAATAPAKPGAAAFRFTATDDPVLHPGQRAAILVGGEKVGRLGRLHPQIEERLDLGHGVYVFEVTAEAARAHPLRRFTEIPKTPSARRDLAFVVDETVTAQQIEETLSSALGGTLAGLRLFDVYRSKHIDSNKKSVAVGLTFQDLSSTLTDAEIAQRMGKAVATLQGKLNAQLR